MDENRSLIKSTRVIGIATLASRILGFVRDVIIAKFFGTGVRAQAFVVAFRVPNLLRSIVGEGSTNSAVVPVFSRLKALGKEEEFWQVASCLLNILIVLLAGLILLGELFAPYIVRALAPGFIREPTKLCLTIRLTRWMLPYFLLIGLTAYAMAVLNSLKSFVLPAFAPCMLNISLIVSALIFCPRLKEPVDGLVLGVLIGGILQLAIQLPLLIKKSASRKMAKKLSLRAPPAFLQKQEGGAKQSHSFRVRSLPVRGLLPRQHRVKGLFAMTFLRNHIMHPRIKEIGRLFLPRTFGIAIYQANVFVDTILATLAWIVGAGAVAALYYANRIVQFPLAVFGVALGQVATPTLSYLVAQKDFTQLKKTVSFSLRSVFTMMIPATVGIMVLAQPLVKIIFERGTFTNYSTNITSFALFFYCLGLTGYAGIKILASCFYALGDTGTPVKIATLALVTNIALNLILMWPLKVAGLALATAISVTVNFILLLLVLRKRMGKFDSFLLTLGKVILASAIMGMLLWFIFYRADFLLLCPSVQGWGLSGKLLSAVKLGVSILAGIALYIGALKVFAKEEAEVFLGWILRKK